MTLSTGQFQHLRGRLIRHNLAAVLTFRGAARHAKQPALRLLLRHYAAKRESFARTLQAGRNSGAATAVAATPLWQLRPALTPADRAQLDQVCQADRATTNLYRHALAQTLSQPWRHLMQSQHDDIAAARAHLARLPAATNGRITREVTMKPPTKQATTNGIDPFSISHASARAFYGTIGGGLAGLALGLGATAIADLTPIIQIGLLPLSAATTTVFTALGAALGGVLGGWLTPSPATVTNHMHEG